MDKDLQDLGDDEIEESINEAVGVIEDKTLELDDSKQKLDEMLEETKNYIDLRKEYLNELIKFNEKIWNKIL